ncbi:CHAD domain-containing protein [Chitinophaga sp. 30R24]|uniref:CHAD domain-containing protein n=1 Tax=Chitinophaga sp. 30R24 TaxID=3248838 RepID=UPI003B904A7F
MIAGVSQFLYQLGANILDASQHRTDPTRLFAANFALSLVMMLQTALYQFLRKECDAIITAYATLQKNASDPEAIHAIRVSVKKLRAFFSLVGQLPGYSFGAGKHLHTVRLIQTIGGAARDTHLQEKYLRSYEKEIKWHFAFAHLLLQNRQAAALEMMTATIKHVSLKKLDTLPEKFKVAMAGMGKKMLSPTILTRYLEHQYGQITVPSSRAHHTVWHGLRKKIKTLYYQLTIVEQLLPPSLTDNNLPERIKMAGELLGKWHDTSELLLFVKSTISHLKKEKLLLPDSAQELVQILQLHVKEYLALCSMEVKHLQPSAS